MDSESESCTSSRNSRVKTYKASVQDVLHYIKSGRQLPPEIEDLDKGTRRKQQHTLAAFARKFKYEAHTDTLYHVKKVCKKTETPSKVKVLFTSSEVEQVLEDFHTRGTNGSHIGQKRTQAKISEQFYWRSMTEDVKRWVAACPQCQNTQKTKTILILPDLKPAEEPWEQISIDLMGPFNATAEGFEYILTGTCLFSRWVEAEPIKDNSEESVFQVLIKWIYRWGAPVKILSHQGKEFNKKLNDLVFEKFNLKHLVIDSYHPQNVRTNSTLACHLKKMVNEQQNDWDLYLDQACWDIRSSYNESTKHTPFEVMLGRKARFVCELPKEVDNKSITYTDPAPNKVAEYVSNTQEKQSAVHAKVIAINEAAKEKRKRDYKLERMKGVKSFDSAVDQQV